MDREGSHSDVDGAALLQDAWNAPNPVPDDLHQETDLNVDQDEQGAVRHGIVDCDIQLMSLAQGILFENNEGRKCEISKKN